MLLAAVMVAWSYFHLFAVGQKNLLVPYLHNAVFITLYKSPMPPFSPSNPWRREPAGLTAMLLTALFSAPRREWWPVPE